MACNGIINAIQKIEPMKELNELPENEIKTIREVIKLLAINNLSSDALVQIIELCGEECNLMTISDYAKHNNLSYNGVKNHRNIIELFNTKFVLKKL